MNKVVGWLTVLGICLLSAFSCSSGATLNPVRYFRILPAPQGVPPSFVNLPITQPFPTDILVLSPHELIYFALFPDKEFPRAVSFSKFTFFNKDSNQEVEIIFPMEAGLPSWCYTPDSLGHYEIRIYFENRVVASQPFEVK